MIGQGVNKNGGGHYEYLSRNGGRRGAAGFQKKCSSFKDGRVSLIYETNRTLAIHWDVASCVVRIAGRRRRSISDGS